jgi:hypothetical protein
MQTCRQQGAVEMSLLGALYLSKQGKGSNKSTCLIAVQFATIQLRTVHHDANAAQPAAEAAVKKDPQMVRGIGTNSLLGLQSVQILKGSASSTSAYQQYSLVSSSKAHNSAVWVEITAQRRKYTIVAPAPKYTQ